MAIEIRPWRPGDEAAVLDLFRACFGRIMPPAFWTWRYRDHPRGGPLVALAWDADRLVAHYGASHAPLRVEGESIAAALSMTTMTHPDYRGQGLLERTGGALYERLLAEGYGAVWGFPNAIINAARQTKLGWVPIADVATLTLDLTAQRPDPASGVIEAAATDARFADLAARLAGPGTIRAARDADILAWRIDRNPSNRYTRFILPDGDALAGYAICKPFGPDALDLVDLVADGRAAADALIAAVAARAVADRRQRVSAWCLNRDPCRLAIERAGFAAGAPVTYFGGRSFAPRAGDLADPRLWRLAMIDSDLY